MNKTNNILFRGGILSLSAIIALVFVFLLFQSNQEFHQIITSIFAGIHDNSIEYTSFLKIITNAVLFILLVGGIITLIYYKTCLFFIETTYNKIKKSLIQIIQFYSAKQYGFWVAFVLISGILLFNVFNRVYLFDEQSTYIYFVQFGPLSILTDYYPNNHVLFNLFFSVFNHLPFDPVICGRLVNYTATILFLFVFYYLLVKQFSKQTAILILVLLSFSYPFLLYSTLARGYCFITIIFCLQSLILFDWVKKGISIQKLVLFILLGIAGFASVISYLYAYFILGLFGVIICFINKDFKTFKQLIITSISVGVGAILFYTPIILIAGIDRIIGNEYVLPVSYPELIAKSPEHFLNTISFLFGTSKTYLFSLALPLFILLLTTPLFIYKRISKNRTILLFFYSSFLAVPIILLAHKVIPYERTWTFLVFPIASMIAIIVDHYFQKKRILYIIAGFCSLALIISFHNVFSIRRNQDIICDQFMLKLKEDQFDFNKINKAYLQQIYYDNRLSYFLKCNQKINEESILLADDATPFRISDDYDFIVLTKHNEQIEKLRKDPKYDLYYENKVVSVFIKKDLVPKI